MKPNRLETKPTPSRSCICTVKSGNATARKYRTMVSALAALAMTERPYVSMRYCCWVDVKRQQMLPLEEGTIAAMGLMGDMSGRAVQKKPI